MSISRIIGLAILMAGVGCVQHDPKPRKNEQAWNTTMINIPGSASDTPGDVSIRPSLAFEDTVHHFGTVSDGFLVTHTFSFVNQGPGFAGISNISATCGCTVPKTWPRQPLAEGERGTIEVTFDTGGKSSFEELDKIITVHANTTPPVMRLHMVGTVLPPALPSEKLQ